MPRRPRLGLTPFFLKANTFSLSASLRFGLIGGIAVAAFYGAVYAIDKALFIHPAVQWGGVVIYVAFMYAAGRADVAQHGASRDFRELTRPPFVVFILINLAFWLLSYSLHLADPDLLRMEADVQIAHYEAKLREGLDPQEANKLREQIRFLRREGMSLPLGHVFLRMAYGAIGGFMLSA